MGRFENKLVVVTGASRGLGYHITKAYIAEGAKVIMIARTESALKEAAASMNSENAIPFVMDVSVEQNWVNLVAYIKEYFGEMDILINNAGIIPGIDILGYNMDLFNEVIATNVNGVFLGMKYCHEVLKKGCYSSIINISSCGGLKGGPGTGNDAAYHASKAAVRNLTKHAAYVYAPDMIRVVSVHPGGINTPMREAIIKEHPEMGEAAKARNPLPPHVSEPENLAQVVLFLTTREAQHIHGSEIICDNGLMAI